MVINVINIYDVSYRFAV